MSFFVQKVKLTLLLSLVTTLVVFVVMIGNATYNYINMKDKYYEQLNKTVAKSAKKLTKNIKPLMMAYQVNEYMKLIETELLLNKYIAIVIQDKNYAQIIGEALYEDGYFLNNGKVQQLSLSALKIDELLPHICIDHKEVIKVDENVIGTITIHASDDDLQEQLAQLIDETRLDTLVLTLLLVSILYILIRALYVKPMEKIVNSVQNSDKYGIPMAYLDDSNIAEISILANKINKMIQTIRTSQEELAQKNEKLHFEKERFELAVDGTLDGMWDWNLQTNEVLRSDRFETMLGYEAGELPYTIECWSDLLHPQDKEEAYKVVQDYLEGKNVRYENTFRMKTKEGKWRWITGRGKAVFDSNGEPIRFVGFNTDVTQQMEHSKELEHVSKHDVLTGLHNRNEFNELLSKAMSLHLRSDHKLAVLFIDLDGFKQINDQFGHEAGDFVLITVSKRMLNLMRKEDLIARLGGDEFVIGLTNFDNFDDIHKYIVKLIDVIKKPIVCREDKNVLLQVTSSIGVTLFSNDNNVGSEALIRQADQAMYEAKNNGKNRYELFSLEKEGIARTYQQTRQRFLEALKQDELEVYYQTKVNMETQNVVGVEALIRWRHPDEGLLTPDRFLNSLLYDFETMSKMDRFVLDSSLMQLSQWIEEGHSISMSINLTTKRFISDSFKLDIDEMLTRYPLVSPQNIVFEILESTSLDNVLETVEATKYFRSKGFRVALDDYGTGYSSLSYLKDLPVDIMKIDKSFVIDVFESKASSHIVEGAIALADAFELEVIAEGVETQEHVDFLLENGCVYAQGYFYSKPVPASDVVLNVGHENITV